MIAAFVMILALGDAVVTEEIRLDWPCTDEAPRTLLDQPLCADYDLHTAWIDAAEHGDRSVVPLLRERYTAAVSVEERNRIAGALLRRVPDDRAIWKELLGHAGIVVRFPHVENNNSAAYVKWCDERHIGDPDNYWYIGLRALATAGRDPRSHALLMTALQSEDDIVVMAAVEGLAAQHDEAALPSIEEAIRRFPNDPDGVAWNLIGFESERADAIAEKYLSEEAREIYRNQRLGLEPDP